MNMSLAKVAVEGEAIPRCYGVAYREWDRKVSVCYPVPLNWLVYWGRNLWFWLRSPRADWLFQHQEAAYRKGFELGRSIIDHELVERAVKKRFEEAIRLLRATP